MKKRIEIISTLLVVVIVIISGILLTNKKGNEPLNLITNGSNIAYMYEDENGEYIQGTSNAWSTGEYVLNVKASKCNNELNPKNIISWDSANNVVIMNTNVESNCTLYFDKKKSVFDKCSDKTDLVSCIKSIKDTETLDGDGALMYHISALANSAEDNGYRYSGNNPNNFICFGPGSENYNNGTSTICPDENLYRIIGYVPVELSTGEIQFRIKVIKSEYATKEDLEKERNDGTAYFNKNYGDLARVKTVENIDGFYWHVDDELENANVWGSSSLYQTLNSIEKGFFHNLNGWQIKIETVQWNVEGYIDEEITAKAMYDVERNKEYGASTQVSDEIGLMYPSDYGFASNKENWTVWLDYYDNDNSRENNWLFNGLEEWTISRSSNNYEHSSYIAHDGWITTDNVDCARGVRPAFYLNSDVKITADSGIDGSVNKPYRVS